MAYQVIGGMIDMVAQPVMVEIRKDSGQQTSNEREIRVFRKMLRFTAFLAFPAMFGLSLVANEFILATIGDQWAGCVPLLRILCIGGAFMPFYSLYRNLVISQGRSDVNMWLNILQIALQMLLILLTYRQGIITVVCAYTVLNICWLLVWQFYGRKMIGIRLFDALKDTLPFAFISLAIMAITWCITMSISNIYLLLITRIILAAALYVAVMKILKVKMMEECINFIRKRGKEEAN
jgi:O-antigen/teichoic acid export membrane protein